MNEKNKTKFLPNVFLLLMLGIAIVILTSLQIRFLTECLLHIMFGFFIARLIFLFLVQNKLLIKRFAICGIILIITINESNSKLVTPLGNSNQKIKLYHYNLANLSSPNKLVTTKIEKEEFVISSFKELTTNWNNILKIILKNQYEYSADIVRIDPYSIAFFSEFPNTTVDTTNKSNCQDLRIIGTYQRNDSVFYSPYVIPALEKISRKKATSQLREFNIIVRKENNPTLVFENFDLVYWAEEISQFRNNSNINNNRKEFVPASFKMPYDQIFYSKSLECLWERDFLDAKDERIGYIGVYQTKEQNNESLMLSKLN